MVNAVQSIAGIDPPFNMIVLVVLIVMSAMLAGGVAKQIREWACHRQELEFKRELVERGMTAEEIVKVIEASGLDNVAPNWGEIWSDKPEVAGMPGARAASVC